MREKFRISVSLENYRTKEETKDALKAKGNKKMSWVSKDITIEEFAKLAKSGYTFCHLFKQPDNTKPLRTTEKNKESFMGAQCIFVDIDETKYETFGEFVDTLAIQPQIVYGSYSDCIEKDGVRSRRFHLVFFFDTVMDYATYEDVASYLYKMIEDNTQEAIKDKCGLSPVQYMNGGFGCECRKYSDSLISLDEVIDDEDYETFIQHSISVNGKSPNSSDDPCNGTKNTHNVSVNGKVPSFVKKAITEFTAKAISDFVGKCHYHYFWDGRQEDQWKSMVITINEKKAICQYQFVDTSKYCSLYYNRIRIEDGDSRRMKLYHRALIRRLLKPNVTAGELFYNWVVDVRRFVVINDELTVENAVKNVESVMSLSMEELEEKVKGMSAIGIKNRGNKHGVIFRFPSNLTKGERQIAQGLIRREIVREMYDVKKSVQENLHMLADNGIVVKKSALYNYVADLIEEQKKEFEKKVMSIFDSKMSINKNVKSMNERGIEITNKTLKKIVDAYNAA